jgi:hypothetical protein
LITPIDIAFAADKFSLVPVNKIAEIPIDKQVKIIEVLRNELSNRDAVNIPADRLLHLHDVLKFLMSKERYQSMEKDLSQLRPSLQKISGVESGANNVTIPLAQLIEIVDGIRNDLSAEAISLLPEDKRIELFDAVRRALPDEALLRIPTKRFETLFTDRLRTVDPVMIGFCKTVESCGLTAMLPRTSEQAAAVYYILALVGFVASRFLCTWLMQFIKPHILLTLLAFGATACCIGTVYLPRIHGVYALVSISACMSLMFPTIFGLGTRGLGDDTKMGGAGMVMAICGAALLTQMQGFVSDAFGIRMAFWVPGIAFMVIAYYAAVVCRNDDRFDS